MQKSRGFFDLANVYLTKVSSVKEDEMKKKKWECIGNDNLPQLLSLALVVPCL